MNPAELSWLLGKCYVLHSFLSSNQRANLMIKQEQTNSPVNLIVGKPFRLSSLVTLSGPTPSSNTLFVI